MSLIPLLTAVIPVTNMSGKLDEFKSTISDCKELGVGLVVVHDKRDPETGPELLSILHEFGPKNFVFLENEYGSAAEARNVGLKECKSAWVAFWDSDDNVYVKEFLKLIQLAESEDSEVAIGKISVSSSERKSLAVPSPSIVNNKNIDLQIANFPAFTRMGFKKSILFEDPFPKIPLGEDLIFLMKLNPIKRKITILNEVVYCYQVGNPTQSTKRQLGDAPYILLLSEMRNLLKLAGKEERRFLLAFVEKLWMSFVRKAIRDGISPKGIVVILEIAVYKLRFPANVARIILFFLTNRPKVIGVIHGK
jgi:glycosyltransferase involved in cell wall biosynthesis